MLSSHSPRRLHMLPLACAAMLFCGGAAAEISDTVHPFVSVGYTYDDNLLRLPENVAVGAQRSDRSTQAQAGLIVDRPIGRQRLTGTAKVSRVTFDHYSQFDYNGKDFKADLAWQLGNRLYGNIGGTYVETLTPFSDYSTNERNLRTSRRQYVSGAWRFHPSWQVRTGFTRNKNEYELLAQRVNNRKEDLAEVGADYLAPSGSKVGLVARQLKGTYLNPRRINGVALDDNYTQDELKAAINWRFSGITHIEVLAGYARRKHDFFTGRDSSGANGRASVTWAPLGKVRFQAEVWREFAAVESFIVSNSLNKGASIGATWLATAKVQANASLRTEKRKFEQLTTANLNDDGRDSANSAQVGLVYAPTIGTQIGLSAFREKRNGSRIAGTNDYRSNGVSINASVQF
ncbi:XrtB/PEP-CTERM-associated polysaccharide biosynthesis outer membrane protein EpsL [Pseudoduganella chitinolytica]|uniref:Outer membrane beta-barrel protein n=1 Tax=Pseudoduganella chitinolytica TaxID=34070 RepID=A0ABY8BIC0_9BURK|nr:XrtB/PEP-CTERM-associated polysaccharide biosynthesis outer membrane protein EpsL [Pseudoduganella chitinolytica]WEF35685.1 outer membrane beta-barrel protein [Pseudoduganella chitinolytica]